MRIGRTITMFAAALSLGLCLPMAIPAANAAPVAPVAGASVRATTPVTTTAPTGTSSTIPLISFMECSDETTRWVDIDIVFTIGGGIQDWCFHDNGTWTFHPGLTYYISNFCSGNNEGNFAYDDPSGNYHSFSFGPGKLVVFPANTKPVSLRITGSRGFVVCLS